MKFDIVLRKFDVILRKKSLKKGSGIFHLMLVPKQSPLKLKSAYCAAGDPASQIAGIPSQDAHASGHIERRVSGGCAGSNQADFNLRGLFA